MKRIFLSSALLCLCLAGGPGAARALPGLDLDLNFSVPGSGMTKNNLDLNAINRDGHSYGVGADAFLNLPFLPLEIGGRIAYNRFGRPDGSGYSSASEFIPSIRYSLAMPYNLMNIFFQGGVGKYEWSNVSNGPDGTLRKRDTEYGVALGVGASTLGVMVMPMYHRMLTNGGGHSYFTVNFGVTF